MKSLFLRLDNRRLCSWATFNFSYKHTRSCRPTHSLHSSGSCVGFRVTFVSDRAVFSLSWEFRVRRTELVIHFTILLIRAVQFGENIQLWLYFIYLFIYFSQTVCQYVLPSSILAIAGLCSSAQMVTNVNCSATLYVLLLNQALITCCLGLEKHLTETWMP